MLEEHDLIVLTADIPEESDLRVGDVGTIVHVHPGREAYVVEFTTLDGNTVAVATVPAKRIRPVTSEDIARSRRVKISA